MGLNDLLYRKRPVTVEAIQFDGTPMNATRIISWADGTLKYDGISLQVPTLEGPMLASKGDWIIKGVKGEFYPCKPDIFDATYDKV